jgi:two-component system, NarL family, response regulator NreC
MSNHSLTVPPSSGERRLTEPAIRTLLIDDHAMVRAGLRAVLELESDIVVVAEAADGEVGVRLAVELKPDVVVMDLAMPVLSGVDATKRLLAECPGVRVLILSAHDEPAQARSVLGAGASGYVLKSSACGELVRAIRNVAAGSSYVDPILASSLTGPRRGGTGTYPIVSLSERELEVVRLVAQGHTAKEMADQLGLSPRTLETYKARAMAKLELTSRADLVRYALRCGWLRAI